MAYAARKPSERLCSECCKAEIPSNATHAGWAHDLDENSSPRERFFIERGGSD